VENTAVCLQLKTYRKMKPVQGEMSAACQAGLVSTAQVGCQNRPLLFGDQNRNRKNDGKISTPETSIGRLFVLFKDKTVEGVQMISPGRSGIRYPVPCKPSGHYIYRQSNSQQFYLLPHTLTVFMCFECISEQTAIMSLYSIN
jgi:hypothetical protein